MLSAPPASGAGTSRLSDSEGPSCSSAPSSPASPESSKVRSMVHRARELARLAHAEQVRKAGQTPYFEHLEAEGLIAGYRIMRRKLGLGPPALREFHIMLEFEDLAQLDRAFDRAASRSDPVESFHHAVNSLVSDVFFALYRDFPDPVRVRGEEKF